VRNSKDSFLISFPGTTAYFITEKSRKIETSPLFLILPGHRSMEKVVDKQYRSYTFDKSITLLIRDLLSPRRQKILTGHHASAGLLFKIH